MDTLHFSPQLRSSWLVQRLCKPLDAKQPAANVFSFGGGIVNGGISKEGMELLRGVFTFDYMGASEFEWGIVPSCLSFLAGTAKNKELVASKVSVARNTPIVYFLCHKDHLSQVPNRIKEMAHGKTSSKEHIGLSSHFDNPKFRCGIRRNENVGWLDCSNGFMFFVDMEMFNKVCALFA